MLVFKYVIGVIAITDFNFTKENSNKKVFPNLYKMVRVAITWQINFAKLQNAYLQVDRYIERYAPQ